ncbi:MAG: 2-oxo acid dehydrogenase subunit E2 [Tepidisphaeraceae bacterium]|jgi:pyruvate dehydrogenase E2 component (dihydrolipoamide acetyltransferase)
MPTITLPVAANMQAGTIRRWRKSRGDAVAKGEVLVEVEGETGVVEVESTVAGTLTEILAGEGKTVAVGAPIATVGSTDKTPAAVAAAPRGTVIPILMPKAGQTMEEGTLVKWHVAPGANIKKGDVIFEIETDKANMEVEATDAGRLSRIVLPEGKALAVLQPVAYLADNDADVDAFIASQGGGTAPAVAASDASDVGGGSVSGIADRTAGKPAGYTGELTHRPGVAEDGRAKSSPAARKIAAERGIDLTALSAGSGPGGRIISTDVPLKAPPGKAAPAVGGPTRKRMSQMRKAIAKNLLLSKQTIPHFYVRLTIDADPLFAFYQGEKAKYPVSLNDVVVMACAKTIMEFPAFRSRLENDEIVEFSSANIGVAVAMDEGLMVPVIVTAERLSLRQIAGETKRLAAAAKSGKIEGMGSGVFTITNMGMFGVEEFGAIINPPEAAILAVGTAREAVVVKDGAMRAGRVMTMTLSADHRLIDGATAAKFLARLKLILESPSQLA